MSETTFLRSPLLYTGAQYAAAARVPTGEHLIFTAGACPLNPDGSTAALGDYRGQAAKVMDNLHLALAAGGADFSHLVKTTVLVASSDREDLAGVWNVVRARMGDRDVPSTLLGVAVLGYPDQLVEVEAIAALPVPDPLTFAP
ncbi:RidA family protein [Arthrobacter crusticola]|uniref:RidA family protein n=1 Tax=Arthrobacter crusticola TaxID=2547960 RepID=A0A4R5U2Z8_9MICC|nr:RidA family protein [Arthrobacter crusticola]TDK28051.1 RidA family protein [Arthrobacter crusticola]